MRRTGVLSRAKADGKSGRIAFRRTWMTPGLSSAQLLDAGVTLRQSQSRKNLKKARHPFSLYFRDQFRCSIPTAPVVGKRGILSARDAVRMMTDAEASWGAPWAVRAAGVRARSKRHDALETSEPAFGADELDTAIERLIELRFQWDREDGIVATSQVPESLFAVAEHCAPYSPGFEAKERQKEERARVAQRPTSEHDEEDTSEYVVIDGTRIHIGKIMRSRSGHPKSTFARPKWGFTGVDTIPTLVADVTLGPLLSSSSEPRLSLRWKAENRQAESVAEVMRLRRRVMASSVVGLPARSAFLLLKSAAATEREDPALDVALLIAMGEHYNGYEMTECLELLRCVRRLAFVRGLPAITAVANGGTTGKTRGAVLTSSSSQLSGERGVGAARWRERQDLQRPVGIPLYESAAVTQDLMGAYVRSTAPSLAGKVWARLPEHSQRLLRQQYYLDWVDLLSLTLETTGSARLPDGLPNTASNAKYASKYLFFRHTLGLDEAVMRRFVSHMLSSTSAVAAGGGDGRGSTTAKTNTRGGSGGDLVRYVNEETEARVKPLVLWMCAAFLVRVVAECLGDVLNHVRRSLQQHAQLAAEEDRERGCTPTGKAVKGSRDGDGGGAAFYRNGEGSPDLEEYLGRLGLPRLQLVGVPPPLQGRMRATKMRIRLLPYEAFPNVFRVLPTPARSATAQALRMERNRRSISHHAGTHASSNPVTAVPQGTGKTTLESPFAAVLQHSALAAKHVERATASLEWATMVLANCHCLVRALQKPARDVGRFPVDLSAATVSLDGDASGSSGDSDGHWGVENGLVIAQREALCERFVKSKVELLMDAVFTFIPWDEAECGLEPLLRIGRAKPEVEDAQSLSVKEEVESSPEADLLAMSLMDDLLDGSVDGEAPASDPHEEKNEELSEAEQQMRATVAKLQACVDDFHIAVADMLDARERFFGEEGAGERGCAEGSVEEVVDC